jgi:predicted Zn-dependent protease
LNEFARQLTLNNTRDLRFFVVESNVVNAFALPNGNIIIYTGILNKMENSGELAGLIGHEVSHVNNRHSVKTLCRNLAGYLILSALLGDVNGITAIIAENAHNLQNLSYSRQFEREADEQGTAILIQNQIDPQGMTQLFTRLEEEENAFAVPEFISTHPLTQDRIAKINRYIENEVYQTENHPLLDELFQSLK